MPRRIAGDGNEKAFCTLSCSGALVELPRCSEALDAVPPWSGALDELSICSGALEEVLPDV